MADDFQVRYLGFENPLAAPNLDVDGAGFYTVIDPNPGPDQRFYRPENALDSS